MTPKKRKIYIVIIIVCFMSTGAVLYFGLRSPVAPSGSEPINHPIDTQNNVNTIESPATSSFSSTTGESVSFPSPIVFPRDNKFDWTLTDSQEFKSLVAVPVLVLDPAHVGRPNPFSP
jgi:hypothetical protein